MVKVFPDIEVTIPCVECGTEFQPDQFHLVGTHVVSSGKCRQCQQELFMEMPASSGLHYPFIVNSNGERKDNLPYSNWLSHALQQARKNISESPISIRKVINSNVKKDKLLILSTIDQTYGHGVFTLFNTEYYRKKTDFHLVVLVQKELLWLVPEGIDEVWTVEVSFSKAHQWSTSIGAQVNDRISQFAEAYLCKAFPQAPEGNFDIEKFTRTKPFPLEEWDNRLMNPTVTFIWRTDRFWKRVLPRVVDNRITRRLFPKLLHRIRAYLQFSWIVKFSEELKRKAPTVDFAVAGMDSRSFKLPSWVKDFRHPIHDDKIAREMCQRYAASHLVIGCNGSSMVLPSFHAGSVVNIVPTDGWAVSAGSYYLRPSSPADVQYRYLLVSAETSIERMVKIVVQMMRDRSLVQILSGTPWNDHDTHAHYSLWGKFRRRVFDNTKYFNEKEGMISR